ncbi:hypothetical protein [Pseudonocardia kongjuensis]
MQDRPSTDVGDEPPASPADALAIIEREQARRTPDFAPYFLFWGVAWLLIGLAWFADRAGLGPAVDAWAITGVTVGIAIVLSAVIGIRMGRGVQGTSSRFGAMYGVGWMVAMIGTGAIAAAFAPAVTPSGANPFPVLFVFVVGVLYMATGAFVHSAVDYWTGLTVQAVAVVTAFAPDPWNSLVMGLGGGGALIVAGLLHRRAR